MKKIFTGKVAIIDFYEANKNLFDSEFIILDSPDSSKLSDYSYILSKFKYKVKLKNGIIDCNGKQTSGDLFELLRELKKNNTPDLYKSYKFFSGGFVGTIAYDYNRYIEVIPEIAEDDLKIEDICFVMPEIIIVKDEKTNEFFEFNYTDSDEIKWNLEFDNYKDKLDIENKDIAWEDLLEFKSNFEKEKFEKAVEKARNYVKEGDIFQVNIAQRFEGEIKDGESFLLYKLLREINPSPFASYICLEEFTLISQSPERLIKRDASRAETRPIAGTRRIKKCSEGEIENQSFEKELKIDEKELAEHVMLVDLERNDLGKVSKFGTVNVDEFMVIEKYSHVMHIVSNVVSELREEYDEFDLINAMFPGGTITGAPKIRAMEIIEELEPTRRGLYTGSVGFIGFDGNLDFNIIIRSFIEKLDKVYFQAGAGIVYDSIPEREYKETVNKARATILAYKNLVRLRNKKNKEK